MTIKVFAILALVAAAGSTLLGGWLAIVLHHHESFQGLVGWVMARYSADGALSSEGLRLITQTARLLMKVCMASAVGMLAVALLLRRVWQAPRMPEPGSPTAPPRHDPEASWWSERAYGALAVALVLMGAMLRMPGLATSLFYDEVFSITHFASLPMWRIPLTQVLSNNHILNSLLLHAMLKISSHEALLRLPVYVSGVASLWLFFLLVRRIGGPLAGVFAVGLAATSTYHLWYSILARGYLLGLCWVLAGLVLLLRTAQRLSRAPRRQAGSATGVPDAVGDGRPSRLACWTFGITQVLAGLALPTLALVPALFLGWLLLGVLPAARPWVGVDPRSPTGSAWLVTALWTVAAVTVLNLPTTPVLLLRAASGAAGSAFTGESQWLSVFRYGWIGVWAMIAGVGLGLVDWLRRQQGAMPWPERFLLALWACGGAWLVLQWDLMRIHVVAFAGMIVLVALGLRALVVRAVSRSVPMPFQAMTGSLVSLALLVGMVASASGAIRLAARATPFEDIRGAVRMAESVLPQDGHILTSGFADREIAYYASRQVRLLSSVEESRTWVSVAQPFCYFRLYAGDGDPVFAYFQSFGSPATVLEGVGDAITLWCFEDGRPIAINSQENHGNQQRRLAQRPS